MLRNDPALHSILTQHLLSATRGTYSRRRIAQALRASPYHFVGAAAEETRWSTPTRTVTRIGGKECESSGDDLGIRSRAITF